MMPTMTRNTTDTKTNRVAAAATHRFVLDRIATPIGVALVAVDVDGRMRAFDWSDYEERLHRLMARYYGMGAVTLDAGRIPEAREKVERYFAGDVRAFDEVRLATGGTPFQREVWAALRGIAAGETVSYGELARRIGRPAAVRAVGLANGANPIGLVVPCHRVIGADGSLTGYGGGIDRKRWLLAHEERHAGHR